MTPFTAPIINQISSSINYERYINETFNLDFLCYITEMRSKNQTAARKGVTAQNPPGILCHNALMLRYLNGFFHALNYEQYHKETL